MAIYHGGKMASVAGNGKRKLSIFGNGDHMYELMLRKLQVSWSAEDVPSDMISTDINSRGIVVAGNQKNTVFCYDNTGKKLWQHEFIDESQKPIFALKISDDGFVYGTRTLYAFKLNLQTGALVWDKNIGSSPYNQGKNLVMMDGYLYVGAISTLTKLDTNGNTVWTVKPDNYDAASMYGYDDKIYSTNSVGKMSWHDSNGNLVGSVKSLSYYGISLAVSRLGDMVVGSSQGVLAVYNPDGSMRWKYNMGQAATSTFAAAVRAVAVDYNGNVYAGSDAKKLYKFDKSGNLIWAVATSTLATQGIINSIAVLGEQGLVYTDNYGSTVMLKQF
ncbi:outer membrane protein assembly factor BamB family protein [Levilactobacillus andaensis]|uniref:outer membrane protein assembly factor BamB family protein n=1 Tax=Levilactobacillus andaensis TaxID=2799570 RepID=UPI0019411B9C|nr:PQQ-binding-like beta-propeller repeat protein [Levilactobacillus andaensis]